MALLTDGVMSTIDDLLGHDRAILEVAGFERIDLTRKLALAQQEIELDLAEFLQQECPGEAAARPELDKVVATAALRHWHVLQALRIVYRDAYSSHLNDRYRNKWQEFERLARRAAAKCFETGIGMVHQPLPRPSPPNPRAISGALTGGTYWTRISWTGAAGESHPSEAVAAIVANGSGLEVEAADWPVTARGWNVYAGMSPEDTTLQNDSPAPLGSVWRTSGTGLRTGRKPGDGQRPDYFVMRRRVLERG